MKLAVSAAAVALAFATPAFAQQSAPTTAHAGLGITEKDWDTSVKYLTATLDELNVPANEKSEVLTAVSGLKKDIVERP